MAGADMLAPHVELPARWVVVEEAAPVWDQVVEGARLDEIVIGDAEMRAGAGPGPGHRVGGFWPLSGAISDCSRPFVPHLLLQRGFSGGLIEDGLVGVE